jgi:hypothetical protein
MTHLKIGGKKFALADVPLEERGPGTLFLRFKLIEKWIN